MFHPDSYKAYQESSWKASSSLRISQTCTQIIRNITHACENESRLQGGSRIIMSKANANPLLLLFRWLGCAQFCYKQVVMHM